MRKLIPAAAVALGASVAGLPAAVPAPANAANVLNVEFKFTPYVGDPANEDQVQTVAGTARVFINGVPYAEQPVMEQEVPVLFDEREIAPAVWLPVEEDASKAYHAQLRWASVLDESTEESEPGHYAATNQSAEGVEDKSAKGVVAIEREFEADFAADLPWHHFPAITELSDGDAAALRQLVEQRIALFQPDFGALYEFVAANSEFNVAELREAKCLDAAWDAGIRVVAPQPDQLELVTTSGPEVVVRSKSGNLFAPADMAAFEKIEDGDAQMCIGAALSVVFPPRLVVVKDPTGAWEVVY
jgi:hypothetical protein